MKAQTLSYIFLNFSILSYIFLNIHLYRAFGSNCGILFLQCMVNHKKIYQSFDNGVELSVPKFGDILSQN
jgi:hypothetical protein